MNTQSEAVPSTDGPETSSSDPSALVSGTIGAESLSPVGASSKQLRDMGLEAFTVVNMHRSALKGAPYNPRQMNDAEKRKLKAGLKRHGIVSPVTWNKKTGNIVGGHQRMTQLDALAGTDDYSLNVAVIDVSEAKEKELNILLNNQSAQGDWDLEALSNLVKDPTLNLEGTGFDSSDLFTLFGDSPLIERNEDLDALADKVREARDRYDAIRAGNESANEIDFYVVVVFRNAVQCTKFLDAVSLPDSRYQSGEQLASICGVSHKLVETT